MFRLLPTLKHLSGTGQRGQELEWPRRENFGAVAAFAHSAGSAQNVAVVAG
jgi:hypothetical protein